MNTTRFFVTNPAITVAVVCLLVLLGIVSMQKLPIRLLPSIDRPVLGVQVSWRAASPREIESEIVEPIERELRGLSGMTDLVSFSNQGNAWINLEFSLGTDMDQTFTEVASRLQRVRGLPADAERPQISRNGGGNSAESLIFLFVQQAENSTVPLTELQQFIENNIAPEFEGIPGVGGLNINQNGGQQIVSVEFDPFLAAQLGLSIENIVANINRSNDVSGGSVGVGRRDFTLRFEGRYEANQLEETILAWRNGSPVRLGDVAKVIVGPDEERGVVYQNGNPAMGIRVIREPGSNTLQAISAVLDKMYELNATLTPQYGITIEKSFDPSVFINRAIALLTGNMGVGILLAVGCLWLFVRRIRATFLIASAIPICLLATFIVLNLFGRTINVISLAGLAFATGMVLDAAIVMLESFVRKVDDGENAINAALQSVKQIGGALLASTITTIVIFVPIVFFEDVEGQLFADLALTIAIAVAFSFLVAMFLLPAGAASLIRPQKRESNGERWHALTAGLMRITNSNRKRWGWITGLTIMPIVAGYLLWPQLNYLPSVKRDAVDAFVSFPSGASPALVREEFAEVVVKRLQPYMDGEKQPALKNYYLFTGPWGGNVGIRVQDQSRVDEMVAIANDEILADIPDTRAFARQGSLFGRFGGGARTQINMQSADFSGLNDAALEAADIVQAAMPGARVNLDPDPQVVQPEYRLIPNDRRLAELGMTRESLARTVRAFGDGLWLGEFFHQGSRLDLLLRSETWTSPEELKTMPVVTPAGATIPFGDLARIERGVGPNQIFRLNSKRTISLNINTADEMPLGETLAKLRELEPQIRAVSPPDLSMNYGGDADALSKAINNLSGNFSLAILLLFLVMAALFKSMKDAILVLISLPMAAVGGVMAMRVVNLITPTPLDLLGMIGFIILLGLVVNNAILLVAETRRRERSGEDKTAAIEGALNTRIRPILMSTLTSLMGMLPLVVAPGAGSAIYKGLAAVIVGGMAVSTLFTLILLPCLLRLDGVKKAKPELEQLLLSNG